MTATTVSNDFWATLIDEAKDKFETALDAATSKFAEVAVIKALGNAATSTALQATDMAKYIEAIVYGAQANQQKQLATVLAEKAISDPTRSAYWTARATTVSQLASNMETKFASLMASANYDSALNKLAGALKLPAGFIFGKALGIELEVGGIQDDIDREIAAGKTPQDVDNFVTKKYAGLVATTTGDLYALLREGLVTATSLEGGLWKVLKGAAVHAIAAEVAFNIGYKIGTVIYEKNAFGINDGIQATIDKAVELLTVTNSATAYPSEISSIAFLVSVLDPSLTRDKLNKYLQASANDYHNYKELNAFVNGIRHTLLGDVADVNAAQKDQFFKDIVQTIQAVRALFGNASFTISAPPTSGSEARNDLSAFLSLQYLTPFTLKPNDAGGMDKLYNLHATLADKWNADRNLTPERIANGEANFSDMYLADRAAMLSWVVKRNTEDKETPTGLPAIFRDTESNINLGGGSLLNSIYAFGANNADSLTGGDKADHLYGQAGDDTLFGQDGNDWLEGGADNDKLYGDAGNDRLYGGSGDDKLNGGAETDTLYGGKGADKLNGDDGADKLYGGDDDDTLTGGKGTDYLYGGDGADKYIHNNGDGNDVIIDSDGEGSIQVKAGETLNGVKQVKGTDYLWESTDHKTHYTKFDQGDGKFTLNITLENKEKIYVKDWENNQLGINLQDSNPITIPVLTNKSDMVFAKDANEQVDGGAGNDVMYATAREKFTLKGGIGNDLILGYGNSRPEKLRTDDADNAGQYHSVNLDPNSETDHTSTDWKDINGQWKFDTRETGGKPDLTWYFPDSAYLGSIWTLTGTDPEYGDVSYNSRLYTFAFLPSAETQVNDEITEVLIGGAGDDLISGSIDADYMDGGDDNDILIGNYGNDFMFGGKAANDNEWRVVA